MNLFATTALMVSVILVTGLCTERMVLTVRGCHIHQAHMMQSGWLRDLHVIPRRTCQIVTHVTSMMQLSRCIWPPSC